MLTDCDYCHCPPGSYPADVPDLPLRGRVQSGQPASHQTIQVLHRVDPHQEVSPEIRRAHTWSLSSHQQKLTQSQNRSFTYESGVIHYLLEQENYLKLYFESVLLSVENRKQNFKITIMMLKGINLSVHLTDEVWTTDRRKWGRWCRLVQNEFSSALMFLRASRDGTRTVRFPLRSSEEWLNFWKQINKKCFTYSITYKNKM